MFRREIASALLFLLSQNKDSYRFFKNPLYKNFQK
jgi:hypothetical protein